MKRWERTVRIDRDVVDYTCPWCATYLATFTPYKELSQTRKQLDNRLTEYSKQHVCNYRSLSQRLLDWITRYYG